MPSYVDRVRYLPTIKAANQENMGSFLFLGRYDLSSCNLSLLTVDAVVRDSVAVPQYYLRME